jgi:hypothetical protein
VAAADAYAVDEDGVLEGVSVLATDSDLHEGAPGEGNTPLAAQLAGSVSHGTLDLRPDGSFTYTPAPDWNGTDFFTYSAMDSEGATSAPATVTITVIPVNDAPTPVDDQAETDMGTAVVVAVRANDVDADGDALSVSAVTVAPSHGSTQIMTDGTILYAPAPRFFGEDGFTYTVDDGHGGTASAVVRVTVHFVLVLHPGWNLVSLPVVPETADVATLFAGLSGTSSVWRWTNSGTERADQLQPLEGYWIDVASSGRDTSEVRVRVRGQAVTDARRRLEVGWNLIGPAVDGTRPALASVAGTVWTWDAERQQYAQVDGDSGLQAGRGYWLYATAACQVYLGPPEQVELRLEPGWNLFSVPIAPADPTVEAVFRTVPVVATVFGWDGGGFERVATLEPKRGYWVYLDGRAPAVVTIVGRHAADSFVGIQAGWNLVAPTGDCARPTAPAAMAQASWWYWDRRLQAQIPVEDAARLEAGSGYWLYSPRPAAGVWLGPGSEDVPSRAQGCGGAATPREVSTADSQEACPSGKALPVDSSGVYVRSRAQSTDLRTTVWQETGLARATPRLLEPDAEPFGVPRRRLRGGRCVGLRCR